MNESQNTQQDRMPGETIEMPEIPMHGPVELAMAVHVMTPYVASPGGIAVMKPAKLTMTLPPGSFPTPQALREILDNCLQAETEGDATIPAGTRLMTKPEFWAHITKREAGVALPLAGNPEFED